MDTQLQDLSHLYGSDGSPIKIEAYAKQHGLRSAKVNQSVWYFNSAGKWISANDNPNNETAAYGRRVAQDGTDKPKSSAPQTIHRQLNLKPWQVGFSNVNNTGNYESYIRQESFRDPNFHQNMHQENPMTLTDYEKLLKGVSQSNPNKYTQAQIDSTMWSHIDPRPKGQNGFQVNNETEKFQVPNLQQVSQYNQHGDKLYGYPNFTPQNTFAFATPTERDPLSKNLKGMFAAGAYNVPKTNFGVEGRLYKSLDNYAQKGKFNPDITVPSLLTKYDVNRGGPTFKSGLEMPIVGIPNGGPTIVKPMGVLETTQRFPKANLEGTIGLRSDFNEDFGLKGELKYRPKHGNTFGMLKADITPNAFRGDEMPRFMASVSHNMTAKPKKQKPPVSFKAYGGQTINNMKFNKRDLLANGNVATSQAMAQKGLKDNRYNSMFFQNTADENGVSHFTMSEDKYGKMKSPVAYQGYDNNGQPMGESGIAYPGQDFKVNAPNVYEQRILAQDGMRIKAQNGINTNGPKRPENMPDAIWNAVVQSLEKETALRGNDPTYPKSSYGGNLILQYWDPKAGNVNIGLDGGALDANNTWLIQALRRNDPALLQAIKPSNIVTTSQFPPGQVSPAEVHPVQNQTNIPQTLPPTHQGSTNTSGMLTQGPATTQSPGGNASNNYNGALQNMPAVNNGTLTGNPLTLAANSGIPLTPEMISQALNSGLIDQTQAIDLTTSILNGNYNVAAGNPNLQALAQQVSAQSPQAKLPMNQIKKAGINALAGTIDDLTTQAVNLPPDDLLNTPDLANVGNPGASQASQSSASGTTSPGYSSVPLGTVVGPSARPTNPPANPVNIIPQNTVPVNTSNNGEVITPHTNGPGNPVVNTDAEQPQLYWQPGREDDIIGWTTGDQPHAAPAVQPDQGQGRGKKKFHISDIGNWFNQAGQDISNAFANPAMAEERARLQAANQAKRDANKAFRNDKRSRQLTTQALDSEQEAANLLNRNQVAETFLNNKFGRKMTNNSMQNARQNKAMESRFRNKADFQEELGRKDLSYQKKLDAIQPGQLTVKERRKALAQDKKTAKQLKRDQLKVEIAANKLAKANAKLDKQSDDFVNNGVTGPTIEWLQMRKEQTRPGMAQGGRRIAQDGYSAVRQANDHVFNPQRYTPFTASDRASNEYAYGGSTPTYAANARNVGGYIGGKSTDDMGVNNASFNRGSNRWKEALGGRRTVQDGDRFLTAAERRKKRDFELAMNPDYDPGGKFGVKGLPSDFGEEINQIPSNIGGDYSIPNQGANYQPKLDPNTGKLYTPTEINTTPLDPTAKGMTPIGNQKYNVKDLAKGTRGDAKGGVFKNLSDDAYIQLAGEMIPAAYNWWHSLKAPEWHSARFNPEMARTKHRLDAARANVDRKGLRARATAADFQLRNQAGSTAAANANRQQLYNSQADQERAASMQEAGMNIQLRDKADQFAVQYGNDRRNALIQQEKFNEAARLSRDMLRNKAVTQFGTGIVDFGKQVGSANQNALEVKMMSQMYSKYAPVEYSKLVAAGYTDEEIIKYMGTKNHAQGWTPSSPTPQTQPTQQQNTTVDNSGNGVTASTTTSTQPAPLVGVNGYLDSAGNFQYF